jgi:hypothetical protein
LIDGPRGEKTNAGTDTDFLAHTSSRAYYTVILR